MMNHIILSGAIALSIFATSASAETARWTGFQFGVSLGESTVSGGGHTLPASSPIAMAASLGNQAGTTGIRVGYNWGLGDNFVLGVGGSYHRFQGAGGGSPEPVAGGPNLQNATTFGALVGYSFGNTMVFLEGGAADGQVGGSGIGAGALPVVTSHGGAHRGSFVSVGLEQALSAHVSMRVAYTQMQFNSGDVTVTASRGYGGPRVEMFTVGFGIHF